MSDKDPQHISVEDQEGVSVIRFHEKRLYDEMAIKEAAKDVLALADRDKPFILVDLATVEYLASGMLGKLITIQRRVAEKGGKFTICAVPEQIMEVFKVSNLITFFKLYESLPAGLCGMKEA